MARLSVPSSSGRRDTRPRRVRAGLPGSVSSGSWREQPVDTGPVARNHAQVGAKLSDVVVHPDRGEIWLAYDRRPANREPTLRRVHCCTWLVCSTFLGNANSRR